MKHMLRCLVLGVLFLGLLPLHAYADPPGQIVLSPRIQRHFDAYLEKRNPVIFAISEDGRFSYSTYSNSNWNFERSYSIAQVRALARCEVESGGVPCFVFARAGEIIYDGEIVYATAANAGGYVPPEAEPSEDPSWILLSTTMPLQAVEFDNSGDGTRLDVEANGNFLVENNLLHLHLDRMQIQVPSARGDVSSSLQGLNAVVSHYSDATGRWIPKAFSEPLLFQQTIGSGDAPFVLLNLDFTVDLSEDQANGPARLDIWLRGQWSGYFLVPAQNNGTTVTQAATTTMTTPPPATSELTSEETAPDEEMAEEEDVLAAISPEIRADVDRKIQQNLPQILNAISAYNREHQVEIDPSQGGTATIRRIYEWEILEETPTGYVIDFYLEVGRYYNNAHNTHMVLEMNWSGSSLRPVGHRR